MREPKEHEFAGNCMVYIITNHNGFIDTECFSYQHYLDHKEKYTGKVLIITNSEVPVYFRLAK